VLARINHEIRVPLNAIIGFAEAMIEQRLGPLGTERYLDYLRDIRAAGERVLTIVSDMLNLTRIETGKLDLAPISVNLNDLVAQCVGVLQPQANRERIIIRSSLAPHLPVVFADAQSLRQIVTSLLASSIELANSGGQVIISTALTDRGEVSLRVRDTGRALSERDIRAATEPYRASAGDDHVVPDTAGIDLALTKALVEANRAQLTIRNAPQAGTLIEVVFPLAAQAAAGG
jgi:signal transduction histidine kinase